MGQLAGATASFGTWPKIVGADVKDAQALMRHSRASTTLDIYQQFVPESQRRAVDRLGKLMPSGVVQLNVENLFQNPVPIVPIKARK